MAEQEKNYLDIEATAAQVKKGIEEVVGILTDNVRENNNKFLSLELDENNLPDDPTDDDFLSRVSLVLKTIEIENPTIESQLNEILLGDGDDWAKTEDLYYLNNIWIGDQVNNERPDNGAKEANGFFLKKKEGEDKTLFIADAFEIPSPFLGLLPPGESNNKSNVLQIGENSHVLIRDRSDVKIGRVQTNRSSSPTRVHIFDGAKVDIDGGISRGENGGPEVYIHGSIQVNIDDGEASSEPYAGPLPIGRRDQPEECTGPIVRLHDKALLEINKGASITATNTARAAFEAGTFTMQKGVGNPFDNAVPFIYLNNNAGIIMGGTDSTSTGDLMNSPRLIMNGGMILFNGTEIFDGIEGRTYDPALVCGPTDIYFRGQGAEVFSPAKTDFYTPLRVPSLGPWTELNPKNRDPRFKIADENIIVIDGDSGTGSNWIKVGANNGGQNIININDNVYHEQSANSIFCMRGNLKYGGISPHIVTRYREENFTGAVQKDGAIFDMEGTPVFIMRNSAPTMNLNEDGTIIDYATNFVEYIEGMETLEYMKENLGSPFFGMETGASVLLQNGAQLNMDGAAIISNENGFTFKIGEDSETFTMDELHQLKALLTNSTIG